MITNSVSVNGGTRRFGFRTLTALITVLFVCSVTVTSFASSSNKVTVIDGEKSVSISAKSTDPYQICEDAGIKLSANDDLDTSGYKAGKGGTIVVERAKIIKIDDDGKISFFVGYGDTVSDVFSDESEAPKKGAFDGMRVFFKKALGINVDADGESNKLFMTKGTVADALEKSGIKLGKNDVVVPSEDTPLTGLTDIRIFRVKYDTVIEKQTIKPETEYIYSDDMYIDEKELVTPGVEGEKTVFYTAKYVDGVLDEKIFENEIIRKEAVNEVVKVGTKKRATLASHKNNLAPISDLDLPADLKLDENGIPVDYAYSVKGKATAYTGDPATSTGRKPMPGHIAVDPKEYPYGTEMYVVSADGSYIYGYCIAADTGGFVSLRSPDIDLYMDNEEMCDNWGNREVIIYVLN